MIKKICGSLFVGAFLLIVLIACGENVQSNEDTTTYETKPSLGLQASPEPTKYLQTIIQATDKIQITIAYITDELLNQYETFVEFSQHGDDPRGGGIAFASNVPVQNFRYIRINGAEIEFVVEYDIFSLETLLPETPFMVDWRALGSMVYGGFAFDDENGVTRYFAFNYAAMGDTAFRFREFAN